MICPFCKEEIKDRAIKCKHCRSVLSSSATDKETINIQNIPLPEVMKESNIPETMKWKEQSGELLRKPRESEEDKTFSTNQQQAFFSSLANGDFGLARTYWLYGVLIGGIMQVIFPMVMFVGDSAAWSIVCTAYMIPVLVGTWRAANRYQGSRIWAVLGQIWVVLSVVGLVLYLCSCCG